MEISRRKPALLQLPVILLMSVTASYAFQHTQLALKIDGICVYHNFVYIITIFLSYVSFSQYRKSVALSFSLALFLVALSPFSRNAIELFPLLVPFLAMLMGSITILIVPRSQGKGFFEYVCVLILPAIIATSRIGGPAGLLATTESIGYYELLAVTIIVVGGYFYLRYTNLTKMSCLELLSNGGDEIDVKEAEAWCNLTVSLIVIGGSGIAALLMASAPIIADFTRVAFAEMPVYALALAMGAGVTLITVLYIFQSSQAEALGTPKGAPQDARTMGRRKIALSQTSPSTWEQIYFCSSLLNKT